jgi:cobalt-zinc-cadmium efflux system protein
MGAGHTHGAGPHGHSHTHNHGADLLRAGARHRNRLLAAFAIIAAFLVVEVVAGLMSDSLALLSDAAHMLTDVIGLGMALLAIELASRATRRGAATNPHQTFGLYRLEILAALLNAILLFAVAIWVTFEAIKRIGDEPEIASGTVLIVAMLGLVANLIALGLLHTGSSESLNVEGAYLEVLADTVGSVGVIIGALLIRSTGWQWIDTVVAVAIGVWILPRTFRLGGQAVRILLQVAPQHVDVERLEADLASIDGVVEVHDLHVWTLTSEMDATSAHLVTAERVDAHAVLDQAREITMTNHRIGHGTFQIEPESHEGCHVTGW